MHSKTLVHLDTENDLISGNSNSGVLQMYQQIGGSHNSTVTLEHFEIALGMYPIRTGCNTFPFTHSSTNYTATISPGNYAGTSLATALQTALNAAGSPVTFTVSYNSIRNKLTVAASSSVAIGASNGANLVLGFVTGQSGTSIESTNQLNLNHDLYIYLHFPTFGNGYQTNRSLTFRIPLEEGYGAINFYNVSSHFNQPKIHISGENFKSVVFEIRDHFGNIIDNQGLPWTAILAFE